MPAFTQTSIEIIDIPSFDKLPPGLPRVFDGMSLAHALGVRTRTLMYAVTNREKLYTMHRIPKKSGGYRTIHAPARTLKYVQERVLHTFFTGLEHPDHITAYVPGRTTRYSAAVHAGSPLLIVMDLKDFFPSTRRSWVRKALQDKFGYPHKVTALLSDIVTVPMTFVYGRRYIVPQGAPTSGAVCNWVANHRLDGGVLEVCAKWGMAYTRYADDLAFSSDQRLSRKDTNRFIRAIRGVIKESKYSVNNKKLRVARSGRQQRLLGMTINEKPNIMRTQYRNLRARIHHIKLKGVNQVAKEMGLESGDKLVSGITGKISYYHMINPVKAAQLKAQLLTATADWAVRG